ncbi:MAG UNVERIFIED_CONTAM: hypothetical protein LVR18_35735 [Planctomycetaceae bacterium]
MNSTAGQFQQVRLALWHWVDCVIGEELREKLVSWSAVGGRWSVVGGQ